MPYKRKTIDEYQVHVAYPSYGKKGFEWEEVGAWETRKEAYEERKAYRENDKSMLDIKIVKKRIRKWILLI